MKVKDDTYFWCYIWFFHNLYSTSGSQKGQRPTPRQRNTMWDLRFHKSIYVALLASLSNCGLRSSGSLCVQIRWDHRNPTWWCSVELCAGSSFGNLITLLLFYFIKSVPYRSQRGARCWPHIHYLTIQHGWQKHLHLAWTRPSPVQMDDSSEGLRE